METGPATLTVTRSSPRDVQQREIYVSLDGERIAMLLYGKSVSMPVSPGRHRLRAHNTLFWKTVEFEAAPADEIRFVVASYSARGFWLLLGVLGVAPLYIAVEREPRAAPD